MSWTTASRRFRCEGPKSLGVRTKSFVFNTLSMFVQAFKSREPREWRVPLNLRWGRSEIPIGIMLVLLVLLSVASISP